MEALAELKSRLEDIDEQMREILKDIFSDKSLDIDEAMELYTTIRQAIKAAEYIEISYTE